MIFIVKFLRLLMMPVLIMAFFTACFESEEQAETTQPVTPGSVDIEELFVGAEEQTVNPLTGAALPEGTPAGRRPVAIMVNNSQASLPQRGVAAADAVVEMVTEGGITRLMALYADMATVPQVGSVRSARDQHLQFAMPLNAITVHIGTSIYASNLLNMYSYQTVDGLYQGTTAFWFDELRSTTRAQEHCWYTDAALITSSVQAQQLPTTGPAYTLVNFAQADSEPTTPNFGDAPHVIFNFSEQNITEFVYDEASGTYKKFAYGIEHRDEEGEQLAFSNVLLLAAEIGVKDDNYCSDFNLTTGSGYYIYGGKYVPITWEKGAPESPLIIKSTDGNLMDINTGKTYIGVISTQYYELAAMEKNPPAAE